MEFSILNISGGLLTSSTSSARFKGFEALRTGNEVPFEAISMKETLKSICSYSFHEKSGLQRNVLRPSPPSFPQIKNLSDA
jgi:hypothetical protein